MIIEQPKYLQALVAAESSDQVKVITGIRRCGKSYLVFNLLKNQLLDQGVHGGNIIDDDERGALSTEQGRGIFAERLAPEA